jgi:hypothetical protein
VARVARARPRLLLVLLLAGAVATAPGRVQAANSTPVPAPILPVPVPVPAPSYCWLDVRLFNTLRLGPVDFCRRNLRYRPGALECYQFLDQVCATFVPSSGWVTSRSPVDTQVFACPEGPEPPVCRKLDLQRSLDGPGWRDMLDPGDALEAARAGG